MIELNPDLPPELAPLSWLLGVWEGSGVVHYEVEDRTFSQEFHQRVSFSHDGLPHLNYTAYSWTVGTDADGEAAQVPYVSETGYWRLSRRVRADEVGPALLPGAGPRIAATVDTVETLRMPQGGFELEVSIVHPDGISELYLGAIDGARIDLATDAVMRTATAKEYVAATRLYGLVDSRLLWAWDIAALGEPLKSHASGSLDRVE